MQRQTTGLDLKNSLLIDINHRKGNKKFLLGKFNEEAKSGYKADPVQLDMEIKEVRHEGGQSYSQLRKGEV